MDTHINIELENQDDFLDRMVNSLLVALVWLGLFALVASLIRWRETGWHDLVLGQIVIYVYLAVLTLLRNRLSYNVRAYSVVAASFFLGVGGLLTWGLIGGGGLFLLLSMILAMLLFGKAAGVWVFAAASVFVAALGAAVNFGMWTFDFDVARYAVSPTAWFHRFLGSLFFFGLIMVGLSRMQEALSKSFASLRESNEALRKEVAERQKAEEHAIQLLGENRILAIRLSQVEEEERKHLARELHDEAGQWLTAAQTYAHIVSNYSKNKDAATHKNIQCIIESIAKAHGAIGNVIRDLRPGALDELGLVGSLRELARQWQQQNPDISFELLLEGELDDLDNTLNITVYRVVQECLTNAAKYAEASHISVRVRHELETDELVLSVGDDGKGMDLAQTSKGFGLRGMRERASTVGGVLTIRTQPGEGVIVEARLPAKLSFEVG